MKDLSDCRVLLVDDAKANLDILVEGLKADHKLSLALNGEMALQIAARTPPDLVLLDIMMPGLDGYEVCRRLRQMPETAEVPIMFLSSLEEVQNKTRGFEAGANDYLTKPFEMLEVKARVRSLLKAKAYSDAVKEQIASELRVAREIQMGMLPHDFTAVEQAYGVEIGAVLEPAREVGGDLYGVCAATPERLVVFLGDVSGKGIPASMFMVRAISLARLLARDIVEPERILARLNDELSVDNPSCMFVTFLCAVFDPGSGRLAMANGGHCRPVLLREGEAPGWAVENLGTALGFEPGLEFERTELTLQAGDALVFYTDGVSEAFNPQDECYGDDRLLADCGRAGRADPPADHRRLAREGPRPRRHRAAVRRHRDPHPERRRHRSRRPRHDTGTARHPEEVMRAVEALQAFGEERRDRHEDPLRPHARAGGMRQQHRQPRAATRRARRFHVTFEHTERRAWSSNCAIPARSSIRRKRPSASRRRTTTTSRPAAGEFSWSAATRMRCSTSERPDENILRLTKRLEPDI